MTRGSGRNQGNTKPRSEMGAGFNISQHACTFRASLLERRPRQSALGRRPLWPFFPRGKRRNLWVPFSMLLVVTVGFFFVILPRLRRSRGARKAPVSNRTSRSPRLWSCFVLPTKIGAWRKLSRLEHARSAFWKERPSKVQKIRTCVSLYDKWW